MYRYQEPPPPAAPNKTNPLALISLITSIFSVLTALISLCAWCLGGLPLIFGIAGAVTGYFARKQIDENGGPHSNRKMAVAGMITGLAGIVLALVFIVVSLIWSGLSAVVWENLF